MQQEELDFEILKETINKLLQFDCSRYSPLFLRRRITTRMKLNGITGFKKYEQRLRNDRKEQEKLKKALTVHLTHFFRNPSLWEVITKDVLPEIFARKRSGQEIVIWSAGCSSGEEPLTIAMCALECQAPEIKKNKLRIIATDIDRETIAQARAARYTFEQFKETPPGLFEKYFIPNGDETFSPKPELTRHIEYMNKDILTTSIGVCEMIVCRNTVIYMDMKTKHELYLKFHQSLAPEGILILGTSEILHGDAKDLFQLYHNDERIYVKI